jgi:hypothetical protein
MVRWRDRVRGCKYYRAHGSPFVPFAEDAANFLGSKPVMEGRAIVVDLRGQRSTGRNEDVNCNNNAYDLLREPPEQCVREAAQLEAVVVMQRMLVSRMRDILALSLDRTFSRTSDAPEWSLHIHPSFIDALLATNFLAQTRFLSPKQTRIRKTLVVFRCSGSESSIQHHTP